MEVIVHPPAAKPAIGPPIALSRGPYAPVPLHKNAGRFTVGNYLSLMQTTYLPRAGDEDVLLDVGCGASSDEKRLAEELGYAYLGMDYRNEEASVLADAHALPIADGAVGVVVSVAVLEHLAMPHLAVREIHRVLRPNGVFIGTVAFLESFHLDSCFHHTHLGLHTVLRQAGFVVEGMEGNAGWLGPEAIFHMTASTRLRRRLRNSPRYLVRPFLRHLFGLSARRLRDPMALAAATGGFRFVARKPAAAGS
jgi:SAM-dependent methyltransferase